MKTIDEAAKENAVKSFYNEDINTKITVNGLELLIWSEQDFKSGVEFAQQWILVEDIEKPEEEFGFYKPVLVLNEKYGICSSAAYKNGCFIPDNPVINPDEITHWRPIELK